MSGLLPAGVLGVIETFAGPLVVLTCFSLILYGIFLAQVLYYWTTYERDPLSIKLWVILAALFETCHTTMCIHVLYYYFIQHYGDVRNGLDHIVWSAVVSLYCEEGIIAVAQRYSGHNLLHLYQLGSSGFTCISFYVYRIWHISGKNQIVTASKLSLPQSTYMLNGAVAQGIMLTARIDSSDHNFLPDVTLVVGVYTTSATFRQPTWEAIHLDHHFLIISNCTWVIGVVVDLLITLVLFHFLYQNRKLGLGRVFSVIVLITYNTYTRSLLFAGILQVLSKLYANSMLAMLNARRSVTSSAAGTGITVGTNNTIELSQLHGTSGMSKTNMNVYDVTAKMTLENRPQELIPV
ncbi:hypothetical protein BDW22DRAFT_1445552 [Trametopsis cervina]|nr:hypothetical protein BDW22DRAFT_1445552 [Trametopsis cervina]